MTEQSQPRAYLFETEFLPNGDIVGGPQRKFLSRQEADQLAIKAGVEAEARARQTVEAKGFASVDRVVAHLAPITPQIAAIADTLRREAAELALIAAKRIAGDALDERGGMIAAIAIDRAVRLLKTMPSVIATAAPESAAEIERRMEQLRREGRVKSITFVPDARSKPGDWRIEWGEGAMGFSRDDVEAQIDSIIRDRVEDPIEPQLDLFGAA